MWRLEKSNVLTKISVGKQLSVLVWTEKIIDTGQLIWQQRLSPAKHFVWPVSEVNRFPLHLECLLMYVCFGFREHSYWRKNFPGLLCLTSRHRTLAWFFAQAKMRISYLCGKNGRAAWIVTFRRKTITPLIKTSVHQLLGWVTFSHIGLDSLAYHFK